MREGLSFSSITSDDVTVILQQRNFEKSEPSEFLGAPSPIDEKKNCRAKKLCKLCEFTSFLGANFELSLLSVDKLPRLLRLSYLFSHN